MGQQKQDKQKLKSVVYSYRFSWTMKNIEVESIFLLSPELGAGAIKWKEAKKQKKKKKLPVWWPPEMSVRVVRRLKHKAKNIPSGSQENIKLRLVLWGIIGMVIGWPIFTNILYSILQQQ